MIDKEGASILVSYFVKGGTPLRGEVTIGGAKNAAVAIIPASILCGGVCRIENIPKISDVTTMLEILRDVGAKVRVIDSTTIEVDPRYVRDVTPSYELARRIRASYYLMGAMLGRFGRANVAMPGGCDLGVRPIDQHIKGFEALGANVELQSGYVRARSEGRLTGAHIYLDMASVGATINIMLAAVLAEGTTVIENAAKEPHIVDLANFLSSMGGDVKGAGTDIIKIRGREGIGYGTYAIIPDQIEAGTYMTAVAAAGGDVLIKNVIPKHLDCISAKLVEMGAEIEEFDDSIRVRSNGKLRKTNLKTLPYPGFPTDMQPQMMALLSLASGTSVITETVFESRTKHIPELTRMGADIILSPDGRTSVIKGVKRFEGATVEATDLRGGAALILAALAAEGKTVITNSKHVRRGYESIEKDLTVLGADIRYKE
jgi:UDP-N-acetylglucosamine 1-carboxyvinyltransferase